MIESQHIEYKQTWKDEYLKWICGFANAQGGTLFIGIDDDGKVCGLKNAKRLLEELPNKVLLTMGLVVDVNLQAREGKEYLSVTVEAVDQPISFKGKYYYRTGSTLQELNGLALQNFLLRKLGRSWDAFVCEHATLDDIDRNAIDFFLKSAITAGRMQGDTLYDSTGTVLRNLDLMTEEGSLRNAAILLFGKDPQRRFISSRFRIGRFGASDSDLMFQDEVGGNLIQMADRVIWVLRSKYLRTPIHYEGLHRVEALEIPEEAMRELVYNAIVHRDYLGTDIQMKVYNDKIWLWNEGELPEGYNTEVLLGSHLSKPRNKLIASVFYKAGFIENWGRGIDKVKVAFRAENLVLPTFESAFGGTLVVIPRNVEEQAPIDLDGLQLTERQQQILSFIIEENTILAIQLAERLNVSRRTINRELALMQKEGILSREGSNQHGHWVVVNLSKEKADGTADGIADGTADGTADDTPSDTPSDTPLDTPNDRADGTAEDGLNDMEDN